MLKRIHVDKHAIARNHKHGTDDPPITVKTYKSNDRCHEVRIDGPSTVVYGAKPLACGARVWIETQAPVAILR